MDSKPNIKFDSISELDGAFSIQIVDPDNQNEQCVDPLKIKIIH
jgi:hypothetical protein